MFPLGFCLGYMPDTACVMKLLYVVARKDLGRGFKKQNSCFFFLQFSG